MTVHVGNRGPGHMSRVFAAAAAAAPVASASLGAAFMRDTVMKSTARLGVTNSVKSTLVFSYRGSLATGLVDNSTLSGQTLFQSSPTTNGEVTAGTSPGVCLAPEVTGIAQLNFNNATGVTPGTDDIKFGLSAPYTGWNTPDAWNTYIITWDSSTGDWAIYWGDGSTADMVDLRGAGIATAPAISTNCLCDWNNTNGLMIGSTSPTGPGGNGQIADIYIGVGECLSNGSGVIPTATLRKFYASNKPQDLSGGNPTGRAPEVLLVGNESGILTNIGTCGISFAASPSPICNIISPGDGFTGHENLRLDRPSFGPGQAEPSTPHFKWLVEGNEMLNSTASAQTMQPMDHKIAVGDIIGFAAAMDDRNGAFNHNIALPALLKTAAGTNQPNTWTSATGGALYPAVDQVSFNVGYKVADAADVRMAESFSRRDLTNVSTSTTSISFTSPALPSAGAAFNQTFGTGRGWVAGDQLEVWQTTNRQVRFFATVNSYNSGTGVANITAVESAGTASSVTGWTANLAGWRWSWTMAGSSGVAGGTLQNAEAFMFCYGGVTSVGNVAHSNSTAWAGSTQIATGGLTTTHANALVLSLFQAADPSADIKPHTGSTFVERYKKMKRLNGSGGGVMFSLCDEVKATAGAYASQVMDLKALDGSSAYNGFVNGTNIELAP